MLASIAFKKDVAQVAYRIHTVPVVLQEEWRRTVVSVAFKRDGAHAAYAPFLPSPGWRLSDQWYLAAFKRRIAHVAYPLLPPQQQERDGPVVLIAFKRDIAHFAWPSLSSSTWVGELSVQSLRLAFFAPTAARSHSARPVRSTCCPTFGSGLATPWTLPLLEHTPPSEASRTAAVPLSLALSTM